MLTSTILAFREMTRHPARGILLVITLIVAVAAWLGLAALAAPFTGAGAGDSAVDTSIVISNARGALGSMTTLPVNYATRIGALAGVATVNYMDVLPVICRPPSTTATLNAVGGPGAQRFVARFDVGQALEAKWNADRMGILVGAKLAANCGWHAGMDISPPGITGKPVEVHVTGIFHNAKATNEDIAIAHYAYVNRLGSLAGRDRVLMFTAYPADPRAANTVAARIEAAFAGADPPVTANTNATTESAVSQFGKVQQLLALVMLAVFVCALLVFVSVLAHTAAERRREMAVLQVLGFSRATLFGSLAIEFIVVVLIGTGLGIAAGSGVIAAIGGANAFIITILGGFAAPAWAWQWLPLWLALLLGAALIAPALIIARLRPIDYQGL